MKKWSNTKKKKKKMKKNKTKIIAYDDVLDKCEIIGTIQADGYVIKKAKILFDKEGYKPSGDFKLYIDADVMWVGNDNCWSHKKILVVDLENKQFMEDGNIIQIVNEQEIFEKILKILG